MHLWYALNKIHYLVPRKGTYISLDNINFASWCVSVQAQRSIWWYLLGSARRFNNQRWVVENDEQVVYSLPKGTISLTESRFIVFYSDSEYVFKMKTFTKCFKTTACALLTLWNCNCKSQITRYILLRYRNAQKVTQHFSMRNFLWIILFTPNSSGLSIKCFSNVRTNLWTCAIISEGKKMSMRFHGIVMRWIVGSLTAFGGHNNRNN